MARMALTALIDDTIKRNDWTSDTRLVDQAAADGHKLNKAEVSSYRLHGMKTIVPEKVIALAHGLQVQPYLVALAALADAGIAVPIDVRSPEVAIEHDPTLSVAARRHLLAIIAADRTER